MKWISFSLAILATLGLLCQCTHSPAPSASKAEAKREENWQILRRQNQLIQGLKDENQILRARLTELSASSQVITRPSLEAKPQAPAEALELVDEKELSAEHLIYGKIIASFRAQNSSDLRRGVNLLEKGYPNSVHLDNAFYLAGMDCVAKGNLAGGIAWFDRILKEQPLSNKAVSALFAKAIAERRLRDLRKAKLHFSEVLRLYPESFEAQRAVSEIKILARISPKDQQP